MRALTLTQPWCGLVASGLKLVENRSRPLLKRGDLGKPFALHASREHDERVYDRIFEIAPELLPDDAIPLWQWRSKITSAVLGVATIDRVVGDCDALTLILGAQRRWYFGPVGYVLRDVRALADPVPCRGHQGFWTLPPDVEARVVAQLSRSA